MAKKTDNPMMEGTFDEAFAAARKAGKETFTWGGKSYHTKTKEEVEKVNPWKRTHIGDPSLTKEHRKNQADKLMKMLKSKKRNGGFLEPGIENID
jgi:hypothetical protein